MKQVFLTVTENRHVTKDVCRMTLTGDTSAITTPGQFVNLKLPGFSLRRPISVCDCRDGTVTLLYKIVGEGTAAMEQLPVGSVIDTLSGLGNGFACAKSGPRPLLIGGGVGVPPLYLLCRTLLAEGKAPTVLLGFNTQAEILLEAEFRALGVPVWVATADGSYGEKGFVTDVMPRLSYDYFYTCGPMPMFRAIQKVACTDGQFSFEERMGCGFGACMGCSCKTLFGSKRVCVDGPVMERGEILWEAQA